MRRPIPNKPLKLCGSFTVFIGQPSVEEVIERFIRRVELTTDPTERLIQAQRAIGALMGLLAFNADGAHDIFFLKDVFNRLATITGMSPDALVTCAGVANS
jgi:hypothetical protein